MALTRETVHPLDPLPKNPPKIGETVHSLDLLPNGLRTEGASSARGGGEPFPVV